MRSVLNVYMKKALIQLFIFFLVLFCSFEFSHSDQGLTIVPQSSASRILYQAKQILLNLKSTRYSHKTKVNEKSGIYILDCSALACYILNRAAPVSLRLVPVDPDHRHARAKNFYDAFLNAQVGNTHNGWQRILRLMDAEPGDLIVWRRNPKPPTGNTGHIVVVMEKPVKEKDGGMRVVVFDSSRRRHARDTRQKGDSGVGEGIMWFRVDESGAPVAIHWSNRKKRPKTCPIVIGRAIDIPDR